MTSKETDKILRDIAGFEEVIQAVACKAIPVKTACRISQRSLGAWAAVINEINDVVATLPDEPSDSYDYGYRQACAKMRELILKQLGAINT